MSELVINDGQYKEVFEKEKSLLNDVFENKFEISHIGSTAIDGAVGRGIVDILVGINDRIEILPYFCELESLGYRMNSSNSTDENLTFVKNNDGSEINLTITKLGSDSWNRAILVRDYLSNTKDDLVRYNLLKENFSEEIKEEYFLQKTAFKDSLINKIDRITNKTDRKKLSKEDVVALSNKYNVPLNDLLYIYLNISGLNSKIDFPRLRMTIKMVDSDEVFYFGLANRKESDFSLDDNKIYFFDEHIADVTFIENDDCASSYFRKNKTVVTLNSNRRSSCVGCKFCPNNLELNSDDLNLDTEEKLLKHFEMLMSSINKTDLSFLERMTICTGCFNSESKTVDHLLLVYNTAKQLNFNGTLHYIGSEIKSPEAMETIKRNVDKFMMTFTVECFTNRYLVLRGTKASVTLDEYKKLMLQAMSYGFVVNYIYILGLDNLFDVLNNMTELKDYVNYFPSINLFQPHVNEHNDLISLDAYNNLEYYLIVRKKLEDLYREKGYKPRSWECYRPLWYSYFDGKFSDEIRI